MKKRYEVRVAYIVYDYYNVVAESEDEAKELATNEASDDSLNDFQLQETIASIESVEDYDGDDEDEENEDAPVFEVCFTYLDKFYRQPVFENEVETDSKNPEAWYCELQSNLEGIHFTLFGKYDDQEDPYQYPRTITAEELEVRVYDNWTNKESWIEDVELGK